MVEAAANVAAEQPIEFSAYGALLSRNGNRGACAAPQNLYQAAGSDGMAATTPGSRSRVATDEQWSSLCRVLGEPAWAADPASDRHGQAGRSRHIDAASGSGAAVVRRTARRIVLGCRRAGGKGVQPHCQPDLPQLASRHFFEEVSHPVIGSSRYSTLPMRFSRGPDRLHERHAPLLGSTTTELLGELGFDEREIHGPRSEGIIGGMPARG